jgi:hypothetical protein
MSDARSTTIASGRIDDERRISARLPGARLPLCGPPPERIEGANPETLKIADVSGDDSQAMNGCSRGDYRVFDKAIRFMVHEAGPYSEGPRVDGQEVVCASHLIQPRLDLRRLPGPVARDLDARLNFAHGHGGKMQMLIAYALEPSHDRAMRARPAQFRHDIGVEETLLDARMAAG